MYVISYDIVSDSLRNKIAKTLEGYGVRIQYSVFECRISDKKYRELYSKLISLMPETEEGSIRFYDVCGNCEKKIRTIGQELPQLRKIKENVIVI